MAIAARRCAAGLLGLLALTAMGHGVGAAGPRAAPAPAAGAYLATGIIGVVAPSGGATATGCSTWGNSHGLPLTGVLQLVPWLHKAVLRFGTLTVSRWTFTAARNVPFAAQTGMVVLEAGGVAQLAAPAPYQMALTLYDADSFAGSITMTLPAADGKGICTQTSYVTFLRMSR